MHIRQHIGQSCCTVQPNKAFQIYFRVYSKYVNRSTMCPENIISHLSTSIWHGFSFIFFFYLQRWFNYYGKGRPGHKVIWIKMGQVQIYKWYTWQIKASITVSVYNRSIKFFLCSKRFAWLSKWILYLT